MRADSPEWVSCFCPKCGRTYRREARRKDPGVLCSMRCRRALSDTQVRNMRTAYENGWAGIAYFSRFYGMTKANIWRVLTRRRYKDVK